MQKNLFVGEEMAVNLTKAMVAEMARNYSLSCPVNATEYIHWRRMCVSHIVAMAYLLVPLALFGVLANLTTLIVIVRSKKLRSSINEILLSLCVSDMMSALLSCIFVYGILAGHLQGDYLNIIIFYVSFFIGAFGTSVVTCLHISFFAFIRFVSIMWPMLFRRVQPLHVKIFAFISWCLAMLSVGTVMTMQMFGLIKTSMGKEIASFYMVSVIVLAGFVTLCSLATMLEIVRRRRNRTSNNGQHEAQEVRRTKRENRAIVQIALVVGSFYLGYLPIAIVYMAKFSIGESIASIKVKTWLFMFEYLCLRISECLNPVFYNLASRKMWQETQEFFLVITKPCRKSTPKSRTTMALLPNARTANSSATTPTPQPHSSML